MESNGNGEKRSNIAPMEMESLQPMPVQSSMQRQHPIDQLWMLLKLYIEYYPKISTTVALTLIVLIFFAIMGSFQHPLARNRLTRDYSTIDRHYNFKASQIDHWCLFGGDDACRCDDFAEPVSREEKKGWVPAHEKNKKRIQDLDYDVVFVGDQTTEAWNGFRFNLPFEESNKIRRFFNKTFTKAGGGDMEGLALGIAGDSTSNLLWRLQHGEMPDTLDPKVWWILIGSNDLARGGCSEEATTLGILRVAEEIADRHPGAVVVIQGILPRSTRRDGSLQPRSVGHHGLFKHHSQVDKAEEARKQFLLWPSIKAINKELEDFCSKHEHMIYFDCSSLLLENSKQIATSLMPDYKHLSFRGHKAMGKAILEELQRIIYDIDEKNDVEQDG